MGGNVEEDESKAIVDSADKKQSTTFQKFTGLVVLFLWVLFIVMSATSVTLLKRSVPDFELNGFRFIAGFLAMVIAQVYQRELPYIQKAQIVFVFFYALAMFVYTSSLYVAVTLAPLAAVQSLYITSNIIAGLILFRICLQEKLTVKSILLAVVCVTGVLFVLQPPFIFQHVSKNNMTFGNTSKELKTNQQFQMENVSPLMRHYLGYGISIISGIFICITVLMTKKLQCILDNINPVLLWSFAQGVIFSFIIMAIAESPVLPSTWYNSLLVFIHCITFVFNIPFVAYGAKHISGNTVNIVLSSSVVFMLISQYTILSDIMPGHRNWIEVVGVFLVLLGSSAGSIIELLRLEYSSS